MEIQKKLLICAFTCIVLGLCAIFLLPQENARNSNAALRIGAGDDASGYLLEHVLMQDSTLSAQDTEVELYTFQDC